MTVYEVAFHLKMTVDFILNKMSYTEFQGWLVYFEIRPPEWRAEDRTFKLLQAQGCKSKAWEIFPSLRSIYHPPVRDEVDGKIHTLRGSALFGKLIRAKGGDDLEKVLNN